DRAGGFSAGSEDQGDVDSYTGRERTTRPCAIAPEPGQSHEDDVRFRINQATGTRPGRSPHRSPGVCSLLGRAGEAPSGSSREVKRRHAEISTATSTRRLTSRLDPDCLW